MFEKASRMKLRFATAKGFLTVEDLWDLPLTKGQTNLDDIAKNLHRTLKEAEEVSFVKTATRKNVEVDLGLQIVKHIIADKLAKAEATKTAMDKRAYRAKIDRALAAREEKDLGEKTVEELKALREVI